jgi:hypothetical protein
MPTTRVDSFAGLPVKPLWSIIKCRVWSTTSGGERGLEHYWRRGAKWWLRHPALLESPDGSMVRARWCMARTKRSMKRKIK